MNSPATDRPANRLVHETSPYLCQHAHNPVDWYPWGEEALQRARRENRPIFLSIGYSACHWCHVMEHESFENDDIARLMNEHFVNIKVDREERPDLDQIYMNAVQLLTGRGGWPMSVFLTPDLRPFFGGTYWPPGSRQGMAGFRDILRGVHEAWVNRPDDVEKNASELTRAVHQLSRPRHEPTEVTENLLHNAMGDLLQAADRQQGGFGGAPKFPHPMDVRLLLRCADRFNNADARDVALHTLRQMAAGGIYDHLGGGFHRYSTDSHWLVPHFEKMLYDNALLTPAYVEAWQITRDEGFAETAKQTLDYVLREMTSDEGGFYATQDADSEGVEGRYFVWSSKELAQHLSADDARVLAHCYDVTPHGNWEGHSILHLPRSLDQSADELGISREELDGVLDRCRATLLEARSQRIAPGRDDKILTAWNGLMMSAMSIAGLAFAEERYIAAAASAARFVREQLHDTQGRLRHSSKDGKSLQLAFLDDYACLINGCIDVYQATGDVSHLEEALRLADQMQTHFADVEHGGYFYTPGDHEKLITRNKDTQDSATPSGNAMAAYALIRLGRLTGQAVYEETAAATLRMLSGQMSQVPMASGQALLAVDLLLGPGWELVCCESGDPDRDAVAFGLIGRQFLPRAVVAGRPANVAENDLSAAVRPLLQGKSAVDGAPTLYPCRQGACQQPIAGEAAIADWLQRLTVL